MNSLNQKKQIYHQNILDNRENVRLLNVDRFSHGVCIQPEAVVSFTRLIINPILSVFWFMREFSNFYPLWS